MALSAKKLLATPRPEAEQSLDEEPLKCAGVAGPIAEAMGAECGWRLELNDCFRRSFVSFRKRAISSQLAREWFELLEQKVGWNQPMVGQRRLPRSAAWFTLGDCSCRYRYGGTEWPACTMEPWFKDITSKVCSECGIRELPNACNANFYRSGSESVGWHADDEPLFEATRHDALIVSLSLGEGRSFELRPNDSPGDVTKLRLEDGDLCTMEGLVQRHYKHRVPPEVTAGKPRINLTWRWITAHELDCPAGKCEAAPMLAPEAEARDQGCSDSEHSSATSEDDEEQACDWGSSVAQSSPERRSPERSSPSRSTPRRLLLEEMSSASRAPPKFSTSSQLQPLRSSERVRGAPVPLQRQRSGPLRLPQRVPSAPRPFLRHGGRGEASVPAISAGVQQRGFQSRACPLANPRMQIQSSRLMGNAEWLALGRQHIPQQSIIGGPPLKRARVAEFVPGAGRNVVGHNHVALSGRAACIDVGAMRQSFACATAPASSPPLLQLADVQQTIQEMSEKCEEELERRRKRRERFNETGLHAQVQQERFAAETAAQTQESPKLMPLRKVCFGGEATGALAAATPATRDALALAGSVGLEAPERSEVAPDEILKRQRRLERFAQPPVGVARDPAKPASKPMTQIGGQAEDPLNCTRAESVAAAAAEPPSSTTTPPEASASSGVSPGAMVDTEAKPLEQARNERAAAPAAEPPPIATTTPPKAKDSSRDSAPAADEFEEERRKKRLDRFADGLAAVPRPAPDVSRPNDRRPQCSTVLTRPNDAAEPVSTASAAAAEAAYEARKREERARRFGLI